MLGNCILYAKYVGVKAFHAFSIEEARCVNNIILASTVNDSIEIREKLQKEADRNKGMKVVFQLRYIPTGKVIFQTK